MAVETGNSEFATDNTPLAAHLITEGYKLKDMVWEGAIATYILDNGDHTIEAVVKEFVRMEAPSSNASQLIDNYRFLVKRARKGF